jgi:hypothetical protein
MSITIPRLLALAFSGACIVEAACTSPADPFTSGPANAAVAGLVTDGQGHPIPATSVAVVCFGAPAAAIITDSLGHYSTYVSTGLDPFLGRSGRLQCRFSEPATGTPRAQLDTSLGFARGPVMLALQRIDLHEP